MAKKAKDLSEGLARLRAYVQGQTVQPGMFSTLDELIQEAPFESNTFDQWKKYLQPGRMLKREGAQFPLKKEEIDYALNVIPKAPDEKFTKEELRDLVQLYRPHLNLNVGREMVGEAGDRISPNNMMPMPSSWLDEARMFEEELPPNASSRFRGELRALGRVRLMDRPEYGTQYGGGERLFHHSPSSLYEESVTGLQGIDYPSHFSPDTVSWSRASTHYVVPGEPQGSVRLVEEIQSDLHSTAADKITYDPETGKVYPYDFSPPHGGPRVQLDITPEQKERMVTERLGYRTPESTAELDDIESRIRGLKTAKADLVVEQRDFLEERNWGMDRLPEEFIDRRMDIDQELERLRYIKRRLANKVPDAPYKSPRDYGALELRKQLLNAVEEGNDYLALTRGGDQIERYAQGMDPKSRAGMMHIYDKVYRSELEKLAKRYGAEVVDIPVNVASSIDVRPPLMADFDLESIEDFTQYVHDVLHESDITDALDGMDDLRDMVSFIENKMEGNLSMMGFDPEDVKTLKDDITKIRGKVENQFESVLADKPGAVDQWNKDVAQPLSDIYSEVHDMYEGYEEFWAGGSGGLREKNFPAIRLTDEVKEKVRKLGVPQFKRGGPVKMQQGGLSVFEMLRRPTEALKPGFEMIVPDEVMAAMTDEELMRLAALNERISGVSQAEGLENQAMFSQMRERIAAEERLRDPEYWKDTAKFVPAMFTSMWKTYNPETGEAEWRAPLQPITITGFESPEELEYKMKINEVIMEENKKFRPGIVDDTLALRKYLGTDIANIFRDEEMPAPEYAEEAAARSEQMRQTVQEDWGLEEPRGLPQHAAAALGTMLAQVPSPKSGADIVADVARPLTKRLPGAVRTAGLVPKAAVEFFDPTVAPGAKSYALGTAFGAGLGTMTEPSEEEYELMKMERQQQLDNISSYVQETWEDQSDDAKMSMLSNKDRKVRETIWESLTPEQKMEALAIAEEQGMLEMNDAE